MAMIAVTAVVTVAILNPVKNPVVAALFPTKRAVHPFFGAVP